MRHKGIIQKKRAWPFWLLLIITFAVIGAENFGGFSASVPSLLKASGGLPILDMRPWYTAADAYQLFDALGSAGRADNRLLYLTADIIIPLSYSLLLWSAISRGALYRFRGLAFLGGAFDYLENIVVLILLSRYPEHLDNLVTLAACFTLLKFLSCGLAIVLAVTGFLIKVFRQSTATAFS